MFKIRKLLRIFEQKKLLGDFSANFFFTADAPEPTIVREGRGRLGARTNQV